MDTLLQQSGYKAEQQISRNNRIMLARVDVWFVL